MLFVKSSRTRYAVGFAAVLSAVGGVTYAGLPNDNCANATVITGTGIFPFDNAGANTDGPHIPACLLYSDVWFRWTASCDGTVTIDTCDGTTVDTALAVYDGTECPLSASDIITCNNNECVYQSRVSFQAQAATEYLVQIGISPHFAIMDGGAGLFTITCGEIAEPSCANSDGCENRDVWNAYSSNRDDFLVADDFTPEADGSITNLCWWGTYIDGAENCQSVESDTFEVRYFLDDGGLPGKLLAGPFSQSEGTLSVLGPARTGLLLSDTLREYEYSGSHEPVAVEAGSCYWIEVSNSVDGDCEWLWETAASGTNRAIQAAGTKTPPDYGNGVAIPEDMAFCFDLSRGDVGVCIPAPLNDECIDAIPISVGETDFDTTGATTDGFPEPACAFTLGDPEIDQDVWFEFVAPCSGPASILLCDSFYDTKMTVYEGSDCPPITDPIACGDDECGGDFPLRSIVSFEAVLDQLYLVRVGGFGGSTGQGSITVSCGVVSIVIADPPDGAIDARQPSEPDGSNPAGWESVELVFDGDTTGITGADFSVALDPPGEPPSIVDVVTDGTTAALTFDAIIPPGFWTVVTYAPSGSSVRLGYLPADANNDGLSNANDVLFLVDALNGVATPVPAAYQTDVDRSGATNASDVLRVIDLLNGAGVYDPWLGATLPD